MAFCLGDKATTLETGHQNKHTLFIVCWVDHHPRYRSILESSLAGSSEKETQRKANVQRARYGGVHNTLAHLVHCLFEKRGGGMHCVCRCVLDDTHLPVNALSSETIERLGKHFLCKLKAMLFQVKKCLQTSLQNQNVCGY